MKFYTWCITVSTVEDIDEVVCDNIVSYLKKKCRYGYVVREMAKKWHLHATVCFKDRIEKKHFEETIWDKVKHAHPTSIKKIALKSNVCYNHKWYDAYLRKDEETKVLWEAVDREDFVKFFPTQEEQDELSEAKSKGKPVFGDAKDPYYTKLEAGWIEYTTDDSYESAYSYLQYAMNVERSMTVISDVRRLCQMALALHRFRTHAIDCPPDAKRFYNQHYGLCSQYFIYYLSTK